MKVKSRKTVCVLYPHTVSFLGDYRGKDNRSAVILYSGRQATAFSLINFACRELWNEHTEQYLRTQSSEAREQKDEIGVAFLYIQIHTDQPQPHNHAPVLVLWLNNLYVYIHWGPKIWDLVHWRQSWDMPYQDLLSFPNLFFARNRQAVGVTYTS